MKLSQFDFNLRPETTLGQIWETVRQWILNSPYSKFKKVPRKLPTKISEGEFAWEADGDKVTLSRAGEGMAIASERIRRGLKWKTILKFTRLKKQVKSAAEIHIDGTIPEDVPVELKAPQIVKQLMKTYGLQLEERVGGKKHTGEVLHDIQKTVHRIEEQNKNRAEQEKKKEARRVGEDKCAALWKKYLDGKLGDPVQCGKKRSHEDLLHIPQVKTELAKYHITTKKQIADAIRNARNRENKT